jgi:hypothetical protein
MPNRSLAQSFRKVIIRAFIAGGVGLSVVAIGLSIHTALYLRTAQSASGTVVQLRTMNNDDGVFYAPVFSFVAADGTAYTISSNTGSNPPDFRIGERVNVLYEKSNPENAKINSVRQLWLIEIVFGIMGPVLALAGFVVLRIDRRCGAQAAAAMP